jgi:hypothetical protein
MKTYRCDLCNEIDNNALTCNMPVWFNTYTDNKLIQEKSSINVSVVHICAKCSRELADKFYKKESK